MPCLPTPPGFLAVGQRSIGCSVVDGEKRWGMPKILKSMTFWQLSPSRRLGPIGLTGQPPNAMRVLSGSSGPLLCSSISLLLLFPLTVKASTVLSVGDGDTITVTDNGDKIRVRLGCIDAPETSQSPYGMAARSEMQTLLPVGTEVQLKKKAIDRYGRTVAEVFKGGINVDEQMIAAGQAFVYWKYIEGCDRDTYSHLENAAKSKSLGVWAVPGGIQRPWDYRHNRHSVAHSYSSPQLNNTASQASTPSGSSTAGGVGGGYIRGSRGGCYYWSGSRKVYVAHSFCG
jgi:endonuclease YncB( thermonuclease family)